jgi:hypothetical protein
MLQLFDGDRFFLDQVLRPDREPLWSILRPSGADKMLQLFDGERSFLDQVIRPDREPLYRDSHPPSAARISP